VKLGEELNHSFSWVQFFVSAESREGIGNSGKELKIQELNLDYIDALQQRAH
jgi:hypothetical protein